MQTPCPMFEDHRGLLFDGSSLQRQEIAGVADDQVEGTLAQSAESIIEGGDRFDLGVVEHPLDEFAVS